VVNQTVGQANVNGTKLAAFEFPLPPIKEQKRIVEVLDELFSDLDAGVAAIEKLRIKLAQYRTSVLKAAVEGKLTAEWRQGHPHREHAFEVLKRILLERRRRWEEEHLTTLKKKGQKPPKDWKAKYREPVMPDATKLPPLPEGWCWAAVDQLGDYGEQAVLTGPFGTTLGKSDFVEEGVPLLTIGCLKWSGISLEKAEYLTKQKAEELQRYQLRAGDLLFSRMASVGRAGYVTPEIEGALFNYHLMRLRLARDGVKPSFFLFYVQGSEDVVRYIKDVNHGATRDGVNTDQLLALPVAFPPIAEQEALVDLMEDQLSVIEHLDGELKTKLKTCQALRQAILHQAFTGQLVPQDPNDEPAVKMLSRIAAERETHARDAAAAKQKTKIKRQRPPSRGRQQRTATKEN